MVKLAGNALDEVRRRVQQATLGRRGHKDDPLYRIGGPCSLVSSSNDVPQEVVRRILDHDSPQTAHYARLHDTTVRRHWEEARKVDAAGETRHPRPRRSFGRGRWGQAAPGPGHPSFAERILRAAGAERLPARERLPDLPDVHHHRRVPAPTPGHRSEVHQIISAAEARGQSRLVEMNRQVADNLDKIITTLEADTGQPDGARDAG